MAVARRRKSWYVWIVVAVVVIAMVTVGYLGYGSRIPRLPGHADPAPQAAFETTDELLGPASTPQGLHFESVRDESSAVGDRMTVYAHAGQEDTLRDASLTVAYVVSGGPPAAAPAGQDVWVNGHRAILAHQGDDTVVSWSVASGNQEPDGLLVAGRGLSDPVVLNAARHVVVDADHRPLVDTDGIPAGLAPLATSP